MSQRILKDRITRFREEFFREKYRFDQGNAFLVFVNFSLLVTTLVTQFGASPSLIKYYILGGLLATWLLGYFLDKFVQVQDIQEKVVFKRSPIWRDIFIKHSEHEQRLEESLRRLAKLEDRLESIEKKLLQICEGCERNGHNHNKPNSR